MRRPCCFCREKKILVLQKFFVQVEERLGGNLRVEFLFLDFGFLQQLLTQRFVGDDAVDLACNLIYIVGVGIEHGIAAHSGIEEQLEVTTGTPQLIASRMGMPKPSNFETYTAARLLA